MDKFLEKYKNNILYINELIDYVNNYIVSLNDRTKFYKILIKFEKRLRKDFNFLLKLSEERFCNFKVNDSIDYILDRNNDKFQSLLNKIVENDIYNAGPIFEQISNIKHSDVEKHKNDIERLRIKLRDIRAYKHLLEREREYQTNNIEIIEEKKINFFDFENALLEDLKDLEKAFEEYKKCVKSKENKENNNEKKREYEKYNDYIKLFTNIASGLNCLSFKMKPQDIKVVLDKNKRPDFQGITKVLNKTFRKKIKIEKNEAINKIRSGNYADEYEKKSFISLIKSEVVTSLKRKEDIKTKSNKIGEIIGENHLPDIKLIEYIVEKLGVATRANDNCLKNPNEELQEKCKDKSDDKKKNKKEVRLYERKEKKLNTFIDEYSRREEINNNNKQENLIHKKNKKIFKISSNKNTFDISSAQDLTKAMNQSHVNKLSIAENMRNNLDDPKYITNNLLNQSSLIFSEGFLKEEITINKINKNSDQSILKESYLDFKRFQEEVQTKNLRKSESTGQLLTHFIKNEIKDNIPIKKNGLISSNGEIEKMTKFLSKSPSQILNIFEKHKNPEIKFLKKSNNLELPKIKNKISSPRSTYINYNYLDKKLNIKDLIS